MKRLKRASGVGQIRTGYSRRRMVFNLQGTHTARRTIFLRQMFSCGRFCAYSLTRRCAGNEHRHSGRLQSRVENSDGFARRAARNLLNTYNEERLENAKNLLRTTDRMFQLVAGDEWWLSFLRTNVVPPMANYILGLDSVRNFIFPTLSQIGINYRHSSLSRHAGDEDFTVKAGDRMPYVVLDGSQHL